MTAAEVHLAGESERERIERWRADALERAGFPARAAAELAARQDVDLHAAIDLVEGGCSPELALQILL